MGNLFSASSKSKISCSENINKHHKIRDDLSQGLELLKDRKIIASTEKNRLEGFSVNQPSISTSSVENKLVDLQNNFESKIEELREIENQYEEEVKNNEGTESDLAQISNTKEDLDKKREEVNNLSTEINNYIQNVAISEIDTTKQDINENDPLIRNYASDLQVQEEKSKIPPTYYALDENMKILERMRYYLYLVFFITLIVVLITLYMMGFGPSKAITQVQNIPQTFSKGFESIF
jgi:DNA repair exonuclease SbcCD ATPase subunit